jgi:hypothetical protein
VILWTVQEKEIADLLERTGVYRCDSNKVACKDYEDSYKWMVRQMIARGIQRDRRYPVWAWYRYNTKGRIWAPTMPQCHNNCPLDEEWCRIKFDAPEELVLLSDFDTWHQVLNRSLIGTERNLDRWWKTGADQKTMVESWQKVFRVNPKTCKTLYSKGKPAVIQACVPRIELDWVKEFRHYCPTSRSSYYKRNYAATP